MNTYINACYRCGKERIFVRSWNERIGNSIVVTKEMACPDPECQKKVVEENTKRVKKYKDAQTKRMNNMRGRKRKAN